MALKSRLAISRLAGRTPRGVQDLLDRQRETARLLATGMKCKDVAAEVGYTPQRVYDLKNHHETFQTHINDLRDDRDESVRDIRTRIRKGASLGVDILLSILTDGTPEAESADIKTKVNVAQDLLDREGSAPKVSRQQSTGYQAHVHLTTNDIMEMKKRLSGSSSLRDMEKIPNHEDIRERERIPNGDNKDNGGSSSLRKREGPPYSQELSGNAGASYD